MHPKPLTCANTRKSPLACHSGWSLVRTGSRCFATSRGLYAACQKGLVEDHSGGYRIEPLRPGGVRIGSHPREGRPGEVCPDEVRPWFDRVAVDLHDNHATSRSVELSDALLRRTSLRHTRTHRTTCRDQADCAIELATLGQNPEDRSCHQHPGLPRSNYEMAVEWTRDGVLPAISAAVVATWRSDVPLTSS